MAASKGANTYNRQNWEDSSFPILCETCLGPSPFVRMMKEKYGKECKICERPFTVFRWCPGPKARFKKTEVCQSCAKVKNVCQTCLFDLEYGLPVEVRDKALRLSQHLPKNDVNREYFHQQVEQKLEMEGDITAPYGGHQLIGKMLSNTASASSSAGSGGTDLLLKLARTAPYYRRNRPHICSFWVKGECRRGEECPYRHEKPTDPDDPLSDQNLRDRYYGNDDPVAAKLLSKYDSMPKLLPPEDRTITTLYIGGVTDDITEKDLRNHFYQFGELRSVNLHSKQHCAFIQFASRNSAERAAERSYDRLILGGHRLTVNWGKSPAALAAATAQHTHDSVDALPPVPGLPLPPMLPPPNMINKVSSVGLNGNFFMTPPPPPPPITAGSVKLNIPPPPPLPSSTTNPIQLAPPVAEPLPPGDALLHGPQHPVNRPQNGHGLLNIPHPPSVGAANSGRLPTAAQPGLLPMPTPSTAKLPSTSYDGVLVDQINRPEDGTLGIHYPSQNPQRMGSVPHTEKRD